MKHKSKWLIEECLKCRNYGAMRECVKLYIEEFTDLPTRHKARRTRLQWIIFTFIMLLLGFFAGYGSRWL